MAKKISRRKFIVRGGLGTVGVLAIGTYVFRNPLRRAMLGMAESLVPPYSGTGTEPNLWFEITKENRVRVHSPKVEMGQGTFTSIAQMVADEFEVRMDQVEVVGAATETGIIDGMSTGGSLSVAQLWQPLREMAATMREMLKIEAAKKLNTDLSNLRMKEGVISGNGQSLHLSEVVKDVTKWEVPDTPDLKPLKDYKYIGKPISRVDLNAKVYGDPIFGMDAAMPDMLHAVIVRPEHVGAVFKSANVGDTEKKPGVVKVVQKDNWIGIVANSYPEVLAAKFELKVDWDIPKKWTEEEIREIITVGNGNEMMVQKEGRRIVR